MEKSRTRSRSIALWAAAVACAAVLAADAARGADAPSLRRDGPGLFERNRASYYRPALDPRLRTERDLPPVDVRLVKRPWSEAVRARLDAAEILADWGGGPLEDEVPVSRYEWACLLGGLAEAISARVGPVFERRLDGPRELTLPEVGWGRRQVRLAVRSGLFKVAGGADFWRRGVPLGRMAREALHVLQVLQERMPVVELPLRFPPPGSGMGIPLSPDPRHNQLKTVYRAGVMDLEAEGWDVRRNATRREAALAVDRLVFIASGYREPGGKLPASPVRVQRHGAR